MAMENNVETVLRSRPAHVWKDKGELTGLGYITDQMKLEEQLKVRLALKMMRKAYTSGSRFARAREKMRKELDLERLLSSKSERKKKKQPSPLLKQYFHETEPIKVKTIDEIVKEAKVSFGMARDKRKIEEESKNYGQLRSICPSLIEEIKTELHLLDKQNKVNAQKYAVTVTASNIVIANSRLARPRSAHIVMRKEGEESAGVFRGKMRPSTASSMRNGIKKEEASDTTSEDEEAGYGEDTELDIHPRKPTGVLVRSNSTTTFVMKSIQNDEKIMKAVRMKEKLAQERENQLKRKILEREQSQVMKQEHLVLQEKRKGWLILVTMFRFTSFFYRKIVRHRHEATWAKQQTIDKKAIMIIHRWWMGKKIWLTLRRNEKVKQRLSSALLPFRFRLRLRRKRRSANMITQFLRDSSGLSEYVRRIYSFRQNIIKIQRWVRSWSDIQVYRVRLLWQAAESIGKKLAKQYRIVKLKNESTSMKALRQVSGFSDTVNEIDLVKKRIGKVLEHQTEASKNRDELDMQIKLLGLPDEPLPSSTLAAAVNGSHSTPAANRRKPVLGLGIGSTADSQYDILGIENQYLHAGNGLSRFASSGGFNNLNSSLNLNVSNGATAQRPNNRSQQVSRRNSSNSLNSNSHEGSKEHIEVANSKWNANNNSSTVDVFHADLKTLTKKHVMPIRNFLKSHNRLGNYSLITLGVMDRFGSRDPELGYWLKKVRSSGMNLKLYELLRSVLAHQRRKYIAKVNSVRMQRRMNPVKLNEVVAFLRDPGDFSKSKALSEAVNVKIHASSLPDVIADMKYHPFFILTAGGLEAIEAALQSNKFRFFN